MRNSLRRMEEFYPHKTRCQVRPGANHSLSRGRRVLQQRLTCPKAENHMSVAASTEVGFRRRRIGRTSSLNNSPDFQVTSSSLLSNSSCAGSSERKGSISGEFTGERKPEGEKSFRSSRRSFQAGGSEACSLPLDPAHPLRDSGVGGKMKLLCLGQSAAGLFQLAHFAIENTQTEMNFPIRVFIH